MTPRLNAGAQRVARHTIGILLGVSGVIVAMWMTNTFAIHDMPARPAWVFLAGGVAISLTALRGATPGIVAFGLLGVASVTWSAATGSSWAAATWWPIVFAVFGLARGSLAFPMAMTATLLIHDAPVLAMVMGAGGAGTSGSPQYFAGFVGAVATPLWFHVASIATQGVLARAVAASAALMTSLAVWTVLVAGSRASMLGLVAAVMVSMTLWAMGRARGTGRLRDSALLLVTVVLLVPAIDYGLAHAFGDGRPILADVAVGRITDTVAEVQEAGPTGLRTRLQLWRQAAVATLARPQGHGAASYTYVSLAYQDKPMLWSGSPHSIWALVGVETGVVGLILMGSLSAVAWFGAAKRGSPAAAALASAMVVMSFDVFASMPVNALVWWAVIGAATGPPHKVSANQRRAATVAMSAVVLISASLSVRLSSTCDEPCDPIARYAGHPRLIGSPLAHIGNAPDDPRWAQWQRYYPLHLSLAYDHATAWSQDDPEIVLALLRAYPFYSAGLYVMTSDAFSASEMARAVASCGLVRFFDGRPIWRDQRSSESELRALRAALELRAETDTGREDDCASAGIPEVSVAMQ